MKWFRDGDQICVTRDTFINLQESPAFFVPADGDMGRTIVRDGLLGLPLGDLAYLNMMLKLEEECGG
ncbi:MAG TPA: hypothetical protein VMW24_24890 [Sedimentisphaerales bacterium]|nr:hypothetical protein [Sedimentisphaerales bacterium]